jgi:hypothetical protein
MIILAIDPGCRESAYVVFETSSESVLHHGFISNEALLSAILTVAWSVDLLAIESIEGFGMTAGQELFDTCFWSGRFCQASLQARSKGVFSIDFARIGRKAIKLHQCGVTTAKDKDIREALIYRFGQPGKKANPGKLYGISGHCWSALAVAVYASDNRS